MYTSLLLTDHQCILNVVLEDDKIKKKLIDQEMCDEFGSSFLDYWLYNTALDGS